MQINEYETVQFVVRWMIENKAGNDVDVFDAYAIEKIVDQCHGDLRNHRNGLANNKFDLTTPCSCPRRGVDEDYPHYSLGNCEHQERR